MPAAVCANGVMDYVYHPVEPLAFRLTLAGPLETIDTINIPAMAAELRRSFPAATRPRRRLRLDRVPCRRSCGGSLVQNQRQHHQYRDRRRVRSHLSAADRTGMAAFSSGYDYMMPSRVVLGVAADVSSGGTEDDHHYRRLRHQRRSNQGL